MSAYPSEVVDTTAAGDSFTAALALEFKRSGDIYIACDMGNRAGSIAVSRMGADASMPTADEVLNMTK
jgi:ribokinase